MQDVTTWLLSCFQAFIDAFSSRWGLIGNFILAVFFVNRVVNFVKRFF